MAKMSDETINFLADNGGSAQLIAALQAQADESAHDRAQRRALELCAEWAASMVPGAAPLDRPAWCGSAFVILSELAGYEDKL